MSDEKGKIDESVKREPIVEYVTKEEEFHGYPYYRISTYEILGGKGYKIIRGLYLHFVKEGRPAVIARPGRPMYKPNLVAVWLLGKELVDEKSKQRPNSELMGQILESFNWMEEKKNETEKTTHQDNSGL